MRRRKLPALYVFLLLGFIPAAAQSPAQLFQQLSTVGLDPNSAIAVREAALDRGDIHISLDEGLLLFSQPVAGHVTGALFVGNGEILMIPPAQEERQSMALFTGAAILNEHFSAAYIRFDDERIPELLRTSGRVAQPRGDLVAEYSAFAANLAPVDALALVTNLTATQPQDHFFHARISGRKLGTFDVISDSTAPEQITVAQLKQVNDRWIVDTWASFCSREHRDRAGDCTVHLQRAAPLAYAIHMTVDPSHSIRGSATVRFKALLAGQRVFPFQLARELKIESATMNGQPLPVILPSVEGSRSTEVFGVVLPQASLAGQEYEFTLDYSGVILADAGGGLVYVRERGKWYPTIGINMASFDLTFDYPQGWQLLATGELKESSTEGGMQHSHWVTERPVPFAGFNLGHYQAVVLPPQPEMPRIESYASRKVEKALQGAQSGYVMVPEPSVGWHRQPLFREFIPAPVLDPSKNAAAVAQQAAHTIAFLQPRLGRFPFSSLRLTQLPGVDSQGFPGLIYLSSLVFLTPEERWRGHIPPDDYAPEVLFSRVMAAHETAHQWWGDKITWDSYREQWLCEAIANYLALMQVEQEAPESFSAMLEGYRNDLLAPIPGSELHLQDAGAVSLGVRLSSSKFPGGYDAIAYGRGTWLIHMLREMYRDAAAHPSIAAPGRRAKRPATPPATDPDAAFFAVLRELQQTFDGRSMTTADLKQAFEQALPSDLRFEDKRSLDWFFESWVSSTTIPDLKIKDLKISGKAKRAASFTLQQIKCPPTMVTSVPVYAEDPDGNLQFLARVFAVGEETDFKLPMPTGATKLVLDPYRTVLRQ